MTKKIKENDIDLYYLNKDVNEFENKKKIKQRERRIKDSKKKEQEKDFELEVETVIGMTNKNNQKKMEENKRIKNKQQKKIMKRKKRIKRIIRWTTIILLISGSFIFATISPIFNIKKIDVINNKQISSETIISLSTLNTDQNIFKFNKNKVIELIKENAYIEDVKINRILPNKIKIDITERQKDFSLEFLGRYAYINNQGYILEISEDKKNLPVIQGTKTAEDCITEGNRLCDEDLEGLEMVIKILSVAKENNLETKITSIDISNKEEYSIYIQEEEKNIHIGNGSNLSNKILYVQSIIETEKGKAGDIFVNGDINAKFQPFFREKV